MFEVVESLQPKKLTEENLEMWEIPTSDKKEEEFGRFSRIRKVT